MQDVFFVREEQAKGIDWQFEQKSLNVLRHMEERKKHFRIKNKAFYDTKYSIKGKKKPPRV